MKQAIIDDILLPKDEATQKSHAKKVKNHFWTVLKKASSHIPFLEDVVAAYYCAFDSETPKRVRAILLAALAYFIMPLDAIPDAFIAIGFTDDVAVLSIAFATVGAYINENHRQAARHILGKKIKNTVKVL